jgi:zinc transport system substrate-binding protein
MIGRTSALLTLAACVATSPAPPPAPITVEALSPPVAWLVREIGGDRVQVREITPAGADPQTFRPPPERVAELASADLIVASGAGFEAWLALAAVPASRLVVASDGLPLIAGGGPVHRHGEGPEHSHFGPIPHVWLDPALYAGQAARVAEGLAVRDPAHAEDYAARRDAVHARLAPLSASLAEIGGELSGRPIVANHPTFAYLGRAAALDLRWTSVDPTGSDAQPLRALVGDRADALALWDAGPSVELIDALPHGMAHRVLDPVATTDSEGGYDPIGRMRENLARLRDAAR